MTTERRSVLILAVAVAAVVAVTLWSREPMPDSPPREGSPAAVRRDAAEDAPSEGDGTVRVVEAGRSGCLVVRARLEGRPRVTGDVRDSTGAAFAGILVKLTRLGRREAHTVATNAKGAFDTGELPPGDYRLSVELDTELSTGRRSRCAVALGRVDLTDGGQDLLVRMPDTLLAGRIVLPTPEGPSWSTVEIAVFPLRPGEETAPVGRPWTATAPTLQFVMRCVPPGRYVLRVSGRGYRTAERAVTIEDGDRLEGFDLLIDRESPATVRLRVTDEDGAPVDGVSVSLAERGRDRFRLDLLGPGSGEYVRDDVPAGVWMLRVRGRRFSRFEIEVEPGGAVVLDLEETSEGTFRVR